MRVLLKEMTTLIEASIFIRSKCVCLSEIFLVVIKKEETTLETFSYPFV